jgi:hypothetical protein
MTKMIRGGCLCGAVQYEVPDSFAYVGYCHCSECRRTSGSAFAAVAGLPDSELVVTDGQEHLSEYQKSPNTRLHFCRVCGSNLFARKSSGVVHLRLGTLRDAPSTRPMGHVFVGSKAPWHEITDSLPQFVEMAPIR